MIEKLVNIIAKLIINDLENLKFNVKENNNAGYFFSAGKISAENEILNYINDLKEKELDEMYIQYKKENNIDE